MRVHRILVQRRVRHSHIARPFTTVRGGIPVDPGYDGINGGGIFDWMFDLFVRNSCLEHSYLGQIRKDANKLRQKPRITGCVPAQGGMAGEFLNDDFAPRRSEL